jgi:hypothetical protein
VTDKLRHSYWIKSYDFIEDEIFQFHASLDVLVDPKSVEISSTPFPRVKVRELSSGRWVIVPGTTGSEQ